MKERPILFSAPMVLALLAGTKTQTRRLLKPQPREHHWFALPGYRHTMTPYLDARGTAVRSVHSHQLPGQKRVFDLQEWITCPYGTPGDRPGAPGDRLWVKETAIVAPPDFTDTFTKGAAIDRYGKKRIVQYLASQPNREGANNYNLKATPSIFMPRWASRITLEVTGVRVERLQTISCGDSIAEGIEQVEPCPEQHEAWRNYAGGHGHRSPISSYCSLWESINGEGSWAKNPWVWVVSFKRLP